MSSHLKFCCVLAAALTLAAAAHFPRGGSAAPGAAEGTVAALPTPTPGPEKTFTVNSLGDAPDAAQGNGVCAAASGACTLRAAFQEANAHAGDDTIDFSVTGIVNLSGALPGLTDNTVISGPGSGLLTVRRNTGGDYRIFTVAFGATVNISGLKLTNGKTAAGTSGDRGVEGGGILNSGTLGLTDVTVSANGTGAGGAGTTFGGNGGAGGGIYNSGTLTMTDCLVSKNTTGRGGDGINNSGYGGNGGGIYNTGTLTMTDCVVDANVAGPSGNSGSFVNTGGGGGGIYSETGTLVLTNLTVSNNRAGNSGTGSSSSGSGGPGGGIYTDAGITTLTNSTVRGNSAGISLNGSDGYAGGIENGGGMTITGSTVSGNTGSVAGGILNRVALTMTNSTVSGNGNTDPARPASGITSNDSSSSLKLTNCTFADNNGFGVEASNTIVRNTIIARNSGSFGDGRDANGFFTSQGHNLVGDPGFSSGFGAAGDRLGNSTVPLDPRLGPLAANGGPTLTHALLSDSPALDAGKNTLAVDANNNPLTADQRGPGFPRIADSADANATATVDIGAFEFQLLMENVTDRATNEDTPLTFSFGIGDADSGTPTVTASSSNQTLVPDANLLITGTGFSRTLQITPAANESGTTTITLTVNGSGGQMSDTFLLTVGAVNDAPAFTKGADQSAGEDSGPRTVAGWATGVSAGPPNESGQSLSFLVTGNTNPALFSAGPSVSPSGTLTYTPAADASGSATITLVLKDDGGTAGGGRDTSAAQSFVINVGAVNDAPVNSVPGAQSLSQNGQLVFWGPNSNNVTISDVDAGQNPVRVTLSATNGTLTLGSKGGLTFVSGDGTGDAAMTFTGTITSVNIALHELTFRPTAGFSGAAGIQITTNDQGHSGSGGALSDTDSVAITVNPGGTLQFSGAAFEVEESGAVAFITVTRTGGSAGIASINYATSAGTAAAGGTFCDVGSGKDYYNQSDTLTWGDGDTSSRTISIPICPDQAHEADETVNLALSGAAGSASAGAQTTAVLTILDDDPTGGFIEFGQDTYQIGEGGGARTVTVRRFGDTTRAITVDYSTDDGSIPAVSVPCSSTGGMALDRCDFTKALGTLRFAAGEVQKTFQVLISDDTYVEGPESAGLRLANPGGGAELSTRNTATLVILDNVPETSGNASDDDAKFVQQNYHDFLNREPDDAGFQFWTNNITSCGANQGCREVKRIDTSAAFFLSVEFRETGFLVYRMYKAAYGNLPGKPVPLTLVEFLPDTQRIGRGVVVNAPGWEQALEANTAAFAVEFAARERFTDAYPQGLPHAQFVDALNANTGGSLSQSERNALVTHLAAGTRTRAQVLRAVAEDADFDAREKNRAFVLMQYFGYLRRNPNDAPEPGLNFNGYNFWLTKLNQFGGDFRAAEMVKAFITSAEYRARFGQP